MNRQIAFVLLTAVAPGLSAEDPKHAFEAHVSTLFASQDTVRMVEGGKLSGMSVGLAYRGQLNAGLHHRVFVDLTGLRAKAETGMSGSAPKHLGFGWDIIQDVNKWSFYAGLFGIRWKQAVDQQTTNDYRDLASSGTTNYNNTPKGTKFAMRLGAERALTKDFCIRVDYTQTEFNKKLNPGWYSLGLLYKFGRM
ncbi:MAG: hypothetical protein HY823_08815 [Acidobacteria bacterium]|nr:hypothetical protein [Acidobacteriota bacterium]